jgi:hypothetical protein
LPIEKLRYVHLGEDLGGRQRPDSGRLTNLTLSYTQAASAALVGPGAAGHTPSPGRRAALRQRRSGLLLDQLNAIVEANGVGGEVTVVFTLPLMFTAQSETSGEFGGTRPSRRHGRLLSVAAICLI